MIGENWWGGTSNSREKTVQRVRDMFGCYILHSQFTVKTLQTLESEGQPLRATEG